MLYLVGYFVDFVDFVFLKKIVLHYGSIALKKWVRVAVNLGEWDGLLNEWTSGLWR